MINPFGTILSKFICKPQQVTLKPCRQKTTSQNTLKDAFIVLRASQQDYPEIIKLMKQVYYLEEPTCKSLGIQDNPILEQLAVKALVQNLSFIAKFKGNGHISGALVNEISSPWDPVLTEKLASTVQCPKIKQLLLFYSHIQQIPNLWKKHDTSKVFEIVEDPYQIVRASTQDYGEIIELMREAYFTDEPTYFALDIIESSLLEDKALDALQQNFSFIAKCRCNKQIVGALINEATNPWDPDTTEKLACNVACKKVKQLLLFNSFIQKLPDPWRCYSTPKVFQMSSLFVSPAHRGQGLGLKLCEHSRSFAADCGFSVVRCDATSLYTAKVCEKMHMEKILEIPYSRYLGKDLEPVFTPPPPHDALRVYVDVHPQIKK